MKHFFTIITLLLLSISAFSQDENSMVLFRRNSIHRRIYSPQLDRISAKINTDSSKLKSQTLSKSDKWKISHEIGFLLRRAATIDTIHINLITPRGNLVTAPSTDFTSLFAGSSVDLPKNNVSINPTQPDVTANVTFKMWPRNSITTGRNYDQIIDNSLTETFLSPTKSDPNKKRYEYKYRQLEQKQIIGNDSIYADKAIRHKEWRNSSIVAFEGKFDGGTNNTISSLFSGTKPNTKASVQAGLVWILPGIYHYGGHDYDTLQKQLAQSKKKQSDMISALNELKHKYTLFEDSSKCNPHCIVDPNICVINCYDTFFKTQAQVLIDSLTARIKAANDSAGLYAAQEKIFDSYKAVRRTYQWISFSGQAAYNNYVGFTTYSNTNDSIRTIDNQQYVTYSANASYNLMHASNRAGENVFFGTKVTFSRNDNTQSANVVSLKTPDTTYKTPSGTVTKSGSSFDAYNDNALNRSLVFDWNTTLMYYFDKNRVFGITASSDLIDKPNQAHPTYMNMALGINFAIPQSATGQSGTGAQSGSAASSSGKSSNAGATKTVVIVAPYILIKDVSGSQTSSGFTYKGHCTIGLNTNIPFTIFGM